MEVPLIKLSRFPIHTNRPYWRPTPPLHLILRPVYY